MGGEKGERQHDPDWAVMEHSGRCVCEHVVLEPGRKKVACGGGGGGGGGDRLAGQTATGRYAVTRGLLCDKLCLLCDKLCLLCDKLCLLCD